MAGRGRGGRGGRGRASMSFSVEQLGFAPGEALPGPVLQPPPTFPPMINKPAALETTPETDYLLTLKRDFVQYLRDSPAFLQFEESKKDIERFSDCYQSLSHTKEMDLDWSRLPRELRPTATRVIKRKKRKGGKVSGATPTKKAKKDVDIVSKLEELEKNERHSSDVEEETEGKAKTDDEDDEVQEKEDVEEEDIDEEMDEGTDYMTNYFDNGESYLDEEDDNLDDGPVY